MAALEKNLSIEKQALLDETQEIVQRMNHVNQLIQAQQDNARAPAHVEKVQVNEILDATIEMQKYSLQNHEIELIRNYGEIPIILGDKHRLYQIFTSLLTNAKSALKKRSSSSKDPHVPSRIFVSTRFARDQLTVQFRDNGIGFPPEDHEAVFSTEYAPITSDQGLALNNGALAATEMGGAVTAQSGGLNHGATFTFDYGAPMTSVDHQLSRKTKIVEEVRPRSSFSKKTGVM